jgi:uroporphyrinogen-III decarboxylase
MMKTTTNAKTEKVMYVTKMILVKPFAFTDGTGTITYKKGRVLETIRNRHSYYYPTKHVITLGHGWHEVIPADHIKAKWFKETTKTLVKTLEVEVK